MHLCVRLGPPLTHAFRTLPVKVSWWIGPTYKVTLRTKHLPWLKRSHLRPSVQDNPSVNQPAPSGSCMLPTLRHRMDRAVRSCVAASGNPKPALRDGRM